MSEEMQSKGDTAAAQNEKVAKPMPTWLRPMTGVFSIVAGLLYVVAALVLYAAHSFFQQMLNWDDSQKSTMVQQMVDAGAKPDIAQTAVEDHFILAQLLTENIGMVYLLMLAFIGCLAILLVASGFGLLFKKAWSLNTGRTASFALTGVIVLFFLIHHSSFVTISQEMIAQAGGWKEVKPYGLLTGLRFVFLLNLMPITLVFSYNAVIKNVVVRAN